MSLNNALKDRPSKGEVEDQGVLLNKNPKTAELEKNLKKVSLNNALKDRPTRDSLEESGTFIDQTPQEHALEKSLHQSMLNRCDTTRSLSVVTIHQSKTPLLLSQEAQRYQQAHCG